MRYLALKNGSIPTEDEFFEEFMQGFLGITCSSSIFRYSVYEDKKHTYLEFFETDMFSEIELNDLSLDWTCVPLDED